MGQVSGKCGVAQPRHARHGRGGRRARIDQAACRVNVLPQRSVCPGRHRPRRSCADCRPPSDPWVPESTINFALGVSGKCGVAEAGSTRPASAQSFERSILSRNQAPRPLCLPWGEHRQCMDDGTMESHPGSVCLPALARSRARTPALSRRVRHAYVRPEANRHVHWQKVPGRRSRRQACEIFRAGPRGRSN